MNLKKIFATSNKIIQENTIVTNQTNPLSGCGIFDTSKMNSNIINKFSEDWKTTLELGETLNKLNIPYIGICHKEVLDEVYDKFNPGMNLAVFDLKNPGRLSYNEDLIVSAYKKHKSNSPVSRRIDHGPNRNDNSSLNEFPKVYMEKYTGVSSGREYGYYLDSLNQVLLAPYLAKNTQEDKSDLNKIKTGREIHFSLVQPKNRETIEQIKNIFHANLPDSYTLKIVADLDAIIFEERAFNALQYKCDNSLNRSKPAEDDPIIYAEYKDHIAFLVQYGNFKHEKALMDAIKVYFTKLGIHVNDIDFIPGKN